MPNLLLDPKLPRCSATKRNGTPCTCAAVEGHDRCVFHLPRPPVETPDVVIPSIRLAELARIDATTPDGLASARSGIWQHLLAGTIQPHVAKVALDLAETIAASSRRESKAGATARSIRAALAKDETPGGGGETASEGGTDGTHSGHSPTP